MKTTLTISIKKQYGQETIVPCCEQSALLCTIAGTKTMTRNTLRIAQEMGFKIVIKQDVKTLDSVLNFA